MSFAVGMLSLLYLFATASGTVDRFGRPLGTDFSNVYAAGQMALAGDAAQIWDWSAHHGAQQALHGRADIPFYGWHYPPPFLIVAALLAVMPYLVALVAWQAATALVALAILLRIAPTRWTLPVALGFPGVFICLGHGQNGFLTAALMAGGLFALERRPALAGILIGLVAYKPQFGLLFPLLLLASGQWRVIWIAALTVLAMCVLPILTFGPAVWPAFVQSLGLTGEVVIGQASTGAAKIVTPYAAMLLAGSTSAIAWQVQGLAIAVAALLAVLAARSEPLLRAAIFIPAALIATPYAFDYDMVVLGFAIAALVMHAQRHGWRRYERSLLAFAYIAPLIGRQLAEMTMVPVNLLAILAVLAIATRRTLIAGAPLPAITASPSRRSRAGFGR